MNDFDAGYVWGAVVASLIMAVYVELLGMPSVWVAALALIFGTLVYAGIKIVLHD